MARVPPVLAIGVTRVARMQGEMVGRASTGHEHREGLAPMISTRMTCRVVMERGHSRKVSRGNRRLSGAQREIPRQLGPERSFQRKIVPGNGQSRVLQAATCARYVLVELSQT